MDNCKHSRISKGIRVVEGSNDLVGYQCMDCFKNLTDEIMDNTIQRDPLPSEIDNLYKACDMVPIETDKPNLEIGLKKISDLLDVNKIAMRPLIIC